MTAGEEKYGGFHKGDYTIRPDGGENDKWVLNAVTGEQFKFGKLQEAKLKVIQLAKEPPKERPTTTPDGAPDEPKLVNFKPKADEPNTIQHPAAKQDHEPEDAMIEPSDDSDPNDEDHEEQAHQEPSQQGPKEKPTEFGQAILDTICAHVETAPQRGQTGGHGHIAWSIGKTSEIVAHVAEQLNKPVKSVAGGLSDLIEKGYLWNDLLDDQDGYDVNDQVCLSHKGWLAFSQWSPNKMMQDMEMESLEDWKYWGGVDGTCFPYNNRPAFGEAQEPTTKPQQANGTLQVPTNGTPAQPTAKATPRQLTYYHHNCHNFQIDGNSLQCLDQQGQTVILVAPKKLQMADMLKDALKDGLAAIAKAKLFYSLKSPNGDKTVPQIAADFGLDEKG